jgi:hypothetical protein
VTGVCSPKPRIFDPLLWAIGLIIGVELAGSLRRRGALYADVYRGRPRFARALGLNGTLATRRFDSGTYSQSRSQGCCAFGGQKLRMDCMETNDSLQLGIELHAPGLPAHMQEMSPDEARLLDTQHAFDSVAEDDDGPRGNNELIQRMRNTMWDAGRSEFFIGSRLLDLGCGTGIDAVEFACAGSRVVPTDWSPQSSARTRWRILAACSE